MAINDDTKLEVLSSHYNETFELQKNSLDKRDKLFLYILILMFVILLYILAPNVIGDWISTFIKNQISNQGSASPPTLIDVSFLGAILWFGLLSMTHTYFQTVLHVQRQLHNLVQIGQ
jgi:hypothetical protein